jgi:drug/metabolite transporter (DMT)-like permease
VLYLLLSIFLNAILFVIIKSFAKFNINALQALVVNYLTAFLVGLLFLNNQKIDSQILQKNWIFGSIILGFIFIGTFYATTIASQRNGLSTASVASKMSIIIPILSGVLLFHEVLNSIKISGIILALIAVYFTSKKEKGEIQASGNLLYPAMVFVGAGTIDASLKYLQSHFVPENEVGIFSTLTFLCAFFVGILIISFQVIVNKTKIYGRNILGGIVLGIPNFFSLYYLIKMLEAKAFQSATLFTIHNIAIVILTSIVGVLFFNEKLNKRNIFGILLALLAIFLVTY